MSRGAIRGRATCIYNYNVPPDPADLSLLSLLLGDTVVILAETDDWYYGHTLTSVKGLFPKSYVYFNENGNTMLFSQCILTSDLECNSNEIIMCIVLFLR